MKMEAGLVSLGAKTRMWIYSTMRDIALTKSNMPIPRSEDEKQPLYKKIVGLTFVVGGDVRIDDKE